MKPLLLILVPAFLLSCSKSYYATVSSNDAVKNDNRELVVENDSVKIVYAFEPFTRIVTMTVVNKLSTPIEVNWRKSSIIIDDQPSSLYSSAMKVKGDVKLDSSRSIFFRRTNYTGSIEGQILADEAVQFLPPRTQIKKSLDVSVPRKWAKSLRFDTSATRHLTVMKGSQRLKYDYKSVGFNQENSTFQFRSFITLSFGQGVEMFMDHHFYVSEVKRSSFYLPSYSDELHL